MPTLRKLLFSIIAAVLLCCASVMTAQAETITFATRAAFTAATTTTIVDFNGVAPPGKFVILPSFTSSGVTFTPGVTSGLAIVDTAFDPFYRFAGASGGVLSLQGGVIRTLNIALGGSFTAVGFDVGHLGIAGPLTITAVLSTGTVVSFSTTPAGSFFGFTTTPPIVSLSLRAFPIDGSFGFNIDNFTFGQAQGGPPTGVPEPATMILLGTGLAGIAANRRRRRKANQDW